MTNDEVQCHVKIIEQMLKEQSINIKSNADELGGNNVTNIMRTARNDDR